ncbi:MAG: hypothetical protein QOC70_2264 [Verrucomicrobiota bacterium]|jgi:hypothetical protein
MVLAANALFLDGAATMAAVRVPENSSRATYPEGGQGACSPNVVVMTNADSGPGSLRQAITAACSGGTISFDMNQVFSPITLATPLVANQALTINGPGASQLTVSGNDHVAVFQVTVASPGVVTLSGLSLTGGYSTTSGGGVSHSGSGTLNITTSIVGNNTSEMRGGGISNNGAGAINLSNSRISHNRSPAGGCGIFNSSTGIVNVTNSTLNNNGAFTLGSRGGGILNSSAGTVNLTNSTVSNNDAAEGAGILNESTGTVSITSSTICYNTATSVSILRPHSLLQPSLEPPTFGGGLDNVSTGPFRLRNSIVALNIANPGGADVQGAFTSLGHNLIGRSGGSTGFTPGANGDLVGTGPFGIDPRLGLLADNGGPTQTVMLQDDSPARDAGDNSAIANPPFPGPPFTDQRGPGFPRILNNTVDIGSFEATPLPTPTPTLTPTATPSPSPAQALNISTRLRVETGDEVMIGGFIIMGDASKPVVLRGMGPSLSAVGLSDVLADPVLELRGSNGALIMRNDNWKDDQRPLIEGTIFQPSDDRESVIVATLTPGLYTAVLSGKAQTTGIGLVEVYDNGGTPNSQLTNISTRGFVQTGDKVMIGGFILGGSPANTRVAIRGIGPSLSQFGLSNFLADPTLELRNSNGALLAANDNWQDDPEQAAQLTASGLGLQDPRESGIFRSPPPGAYTAILAGKNGGIGLGLTEIYNLQ